VSSEASCDLQRRWNLSPELADRVLLVMADWETETSMGIEVISGGRTDAQQLELGRRGRPTASIELSTHTECPATGVDFRINGFATTLMRARFGRIVFERGLRWGGGSKVDPETLIPIDWNHADLGPRRTS